MSKSPAERTRFRFVRILPFGFYARAAADKKPRNSSVSYGKKRVRNGKRNAVFR